MTPTPPHLETLLAHEGWVRGFARSLARDEAEADDLAQDAWLETVHTLPVDDRSPRGWFATLLRRRAAKYRRGEKRRGARERLSARPEAIPSAVDRVDRAEVLERIVRAVLDLEEPLRATVLMRFFDGLSPMEISRLTGTPPDTVKSRLRRALERLRSRFDREHEGDRRAWLALLLPWTGPATGHNAPPAGREGPWIEGVVAMSAKKALAVLAAVLLLGLAWMFLPDSRAGALPVETADVAVPLPATASSPASPPDAMETAAPSMLAGPREDATPPIPGAAVRIRIVDARMVPLEGPAAHAALGESPRAHLVDPAAWEEQTLGAALRTMLGDPSEWTREVDVQWSDDAWRLTKPVPAGRWILVISGAERVPTALDPFLAVDGEDALVEFRLPAVSGTRSVRIVEAESGVPLPGATATAWFEYGDDRAFLPGRPVVADASGTLAIPLVPAQGRGRPATWWFQSEGRAATLSDGELRRGSDPLDLPLPRTARVEGTARRADGSPAAGCIVGTIMKGLPVRTRVATDGTFALDGIPTGRGTLELLLVESWDPPLFSRAKAALEPGGTAIVSVGPSPEESEGCSLSGRITWGGQPFPRALVLLRSAVAGRELERTGATDAEGRWQLGGLPSGPVRLTIHLSSVDDFRLTSTDPISLAPGESRSFDFDLPAGRARVRVLSSKDGTPVPGAIVMLRPQDRSVERDRFPGWACTSGMAAATGADGAALLVALPVGVPLAGLSAGDMKSTPVEFTATAGTDLEGGPVIEVHIPR